MKKALIICKYFAPYNMVAAIRPTKLAKYLSRTEQWEVTVLCAPFTGTKRDAILEKDRKDIANIITISEGRLTKGFQWLSKVLLKIRNGMSGSGEVEKSAAVERVSYKESMPEERSAAKEFLMNLYTIHFIIEQHLIARDAWKSLKRNGVEYDLIFSTYNPLSDIFIGMKCKRKQKNAVWIQDFRDIIYSKSAQPVSYCGYAERLMKQVNKFADCITAVSEGVLDKIGAAKNIAVCMTNGFDYEDLDKGEACTGIRRDHFNLLYTGTIYENGSSLEPVFRAFNHLAQQGMLENDIKILYAGNDFDRLLEQAKQYGCEGQLADLGFLSREQSIWMQQQADILLIATSNNTELEGLVPAKTYEHLMTGRPIIGVVSGDKPNSKLKTFIEGANAGVCVETEVNPLEQSILESFLADRYQVFKKRKEDTFQINKEYIDRFYWQNLANNIVQIYHRLHE